MPLDVSNLFRLIGAATVLRTLHCATAKIAKTAKKASRTSSTLGAEWRPWRLLRMLLGIVVKRSVEVSVPGALSVSTKD